MIEILLPALLIGLLLAAIAGPLGCFVVWGRLAYFGDTLAHSALLGIALGFLFQLNLTVGVILVTSVLALALTVLQGQRFDPRGDYIRRHVPELAGLPAALIHEPWKAGPLELAACGVGPGDYPAPLVSHEEGRRRALGALQQMKSRQGT